MGFWHSFGGRYGVSNPSVLELKMTEDDKRLEPLLLQCVGITSWANTHPQLKLNFARFKELADLLRRTRNEVLKTGSSENELVAEWLKNNTNLAYIIMWQSALGHITLNDHSRDDVLDAMHLFTLNYEQKEPINPVIIGGLYRAFKEYLDPNKKDYRTLDQIMRLKGDKSHSNNNLVIPEKMRTFTHMIIETQKTKTAIAKELKEKDTDKRPKGYDYYNDNFDIFKWNILNDYIWEKAVVGKNRLAILPKQRARITEFWDGYELPEKLYVDENLVPSGDIEYIRQLQKRLN